MRTDTALVVHTSQSKLSEPNEAMLEIDRKSRTRILRESPQIATNASKIDHPDENAWSAGRFASR